MNHFTGPIEPESSMFDLTNLYSVSYSGGPRGGGRGGGGDRRGGRDDSRGGGGGGGGGGNQGKMEARAGDWDCPS